MATSGTQEFNLDLNNLVEEAFERCGATMTTGYDLRTARRSLNLLLIEWANRGINLWTVSQYTVALNPGSAVYLLPTAVVDVLDCVVRVASGGRVSDRPLHRMSAASYASLPDKFSLGEPTQVWVDRQSGAVAATSATVQGPVPDTDTFIPLTSTEGLPPYGAVRIGDEVLTYSGVLHGMLAGCVRGEDAQAFVGGEAVFLHRQPTVALWPVPSGNEARYLNVWYLRRMDEAGPGGMHHQDVPYRFLPALAAGLAYYLAAKIPGVNADRAMLLKQDYEEQWAMAASEDREKSTLRIVPRMSAW